VIAARGVSGDHEDDRVQARADRHRSKKMWPPRIAPERRIVRTTPSGVARRREVLSVGRESRSTSGLVCSPVS
jgi:hypothetical protein